MKSTDIFPSKYLKAADLNGAEPIVTIDRVENTTIGNETKPIVFFRGKEKGMVLNKTNWASIEDLTGQDDSDNWSGAKIKLITAKVMFEGKLVPAIRVEKAPTDVRAAAAQRMQQVRIPEPVAVPDDSDIPFSIVLPFLAVLGSFLA